MTLPRCDCLIHCGDDPWLASGKARPCERRVQQAEEDRAARVEQERVNRMNAAATDLLTACVLAEAFIAGFEDDPTQEGVPAALLVIRGAIAKALPEGTPT